MLQWFSGFQFLAPFVLFGAFAIPALIYAYLRKQSTKRRTVSSVIVLKDLLPKQTVRRKFSPPLRFFLELLTLLALCLAGAMPVLKDEQKQLAVLIDNSLSMRAIDSKLSGAETRLERAQKEAKKWIDDQPGSYHFTVFTSSPKLERRSAEGVTKSEASSTVGGIAPTFTNDTLEAAVDDLGGSGKYERVVVVSDRAIDTSEDEGAAGTSAVNSLFSENQTGVKHYTSVGALDVGERTANVYVANLTVTKTGMSSGGAKLVAAIGYSGPGSVDAKVTFTAPGRQNGASDSNLGSGSLKLSAEKLSELGVDLPDAKAADSAYKVAVSLLKGDAGGDSLPDDDVAWAASGASGKSRVLLVSPSLSDASHGLGSLDNLSVQAIKPEDYAKLTEEQLNDYELLIFHHAAPVLVPRRAALLILPPNDNAVFPVRTEVQSPRITSWASEHPLSSYLRVPLLNLPAAQIFDVPLWAQSVIRVEAGTVLVAGESRGIRFAGAGMELLPFEGAKTPTSSVLMLNLLNWLSGGGQLTGSTLSGTLYHLDEGKNLQVELPNGKTQALSDARTLMLADPGLYRLRDESGSTQKVIPVNAFYPEESATFQQLSFHTRRMYEHEKLVDEDSRLLWPAILLFALSVLSIELILSLREGRVEQVA